MCLKVLEGFTSGSLEVVGLKGVGIRGFSWGFTGSYHAMGVVEFEEFRGVSCPTGGLVRAPPCGAGLSVLRSVVGMRSDRREERQRQVVRHLRWRSEEPGKTKD